MSHKPGLLLAALLLAWTRGATAAGESTTALARFENLTVTSIDLSGHKVTKDYVIRREILTRAGEPLRVATLDEDIQRLDNLSIFAEVSADAEADGKGVKVRFHFKEMPSWIPLVGASYNEQDGFSAGPKISALNLTGRGISVNGKAYFGGSKKYEVGLSWPWIGGDHVSLNFRGARLSRYDELNDFHETSYEFTPQVGRYIGEHGRLKGKFSLFRMESDVDGKTLAPDNNDQLSRFGASFGWDTRDSWRFPRTGWLNEIEVWNTGLLGGDGDFWTVSLDVRRWIPTVKGQRLMLSGLASLQSGTVDTDIPVYMIYRLGGANSIRGYSIQELGKTLYGKNQLLGTAEYSFNLLPSSAGTSGNSLSGSVWTWRFSPTWARRGATRASSWRSGPEAEAGPGCGCWYPARRWSAWTWAGAGRAASSSISRAAPSRPRNGTACAEWRGKRMTYRQTMPGRSPELLRLTQCSVLVAGVLLASVPAKAQDAQYWNIQYGPAAQLLGGLVVGSSRDLSATYYNPGGLALGTSSDFLLSAQAFKAESLSTKPVDGGQVLDNSQTQFDVFPGFFAFSFPKSWFGDNTRMAFSLLTRQQFNMRIDQRFAGDTSSGNGRYGIETLFDQRMSETWGGITLSHQISNHFGLGATVYGIYRGQRTRLEQSLQLAYPDGRGVSALAIDDFDYSHWRALAKVGLAWEGDRLRLGTAITTPRVAVTGSGNLGFTRSANGADLTGDGKPDNLLVNAYDDKLDAGYNSSWAFSAGAAWRQGSLQWHASAEYFAPVKDFTILEGRTVDSAGRPLTLVQQLDGVFNLGGGAEYWLGGVTADKGASSGATVLYAAFITDFSASPTVVQNEAASSNMNLYHVSAGSAFSLGSSRFSLGLTWAFGSRTRDFGFDALPPSVPLLGEARPVDARYSRVVFVLGYLFGSDK